MDYLKTHHSERLTFKPLTETDKPQWVRFLTNKQANKYMPPVAQVADYVEPWFEKQFMRYENNMFGFLGIHLEGHEEIIGQCGLLLQDLHGEKVIEVGYHLMPEFWGNGYATEAAQYFKKLAFDNNLTDKLYSMIHEDNLPSKKVALRNGMSLEGKTTVWNLPVELFTIYNTRK
ncbi:MAG: GNAT family N-acetyltransferase [Flavobacteriales bacterium]